MNVMLKRMPSQIAAWALYIFLLILAIFIGLIASTGNLLLIGVLGGGLVAIVALSYSRLLLWFSIVGGIVVAGSARLYYPPLHIISWVVVGTSFLLLFYIVGEWFKKSIGTSHHGETPALIYLAILFILLAGISTGINKTPLGTTISGIKGYLQIWPLMFVLALVKWDERTMRAIPRVMFWIALLQIPFVLHQYIVLVPKRFGMGYGVVPVDIVAGTFGGDMNGGGSNATLALFLIMIWAGVIALWKFKLLSNWRMLVASLLLLFPLFLNESKISMIYLIMVFFSLYREDIVRRPHVFIVGLAFLGVLLAGLLTSYVAIHASENNTTMGAYVQQTIDENIGDKRSNWSMYLNRYSVYGFWASRHGFNDPVHTLIGHGLAQSKDAAGAIPITNLANQQYQGMGIGLTSLSSMLWDVGVLGTGCMLAMFWWGWRVSRSIACRSQDDLGTVAIFRTIEAIIPVFVLSLAHKNLFVFDLPSQTLLLGTLGFIAYWQRCVSAQSLYGHAATSKVRNR